MSNIDEYFNSGEVSRAFKTLFSESKISGFEHTGIFGSFNNFNTAKPALFNSSLIREMNNLGVILFGHGCEKSMTSDFLFTKTHLFVYSLVDHWGIVNKDPRYDNTDTWYCKHGELTEIIPFTNITNIEVGNGKKFYSWEAETVQKNGDPLKGALISGMLAGSTGAIIGAAANSGKRKVVVVPAGFVNENVFSIRLTIPGKRTRILEMKALDVTKGTRDKYFTIDYMNFYNRINALLTGGISFSLAEINNRELATKKISDFITKIISDEIEKKAISDAAQSFWLSHPETKPIWENTIGYIQEEKSANQKKTNEVNRSIILHVQEKQREVTNQIDQTNELLRSAGFFKKGKIKKELAALQTKLNSIKRDYKFDDFMITTLEELNVLRETDVRLDEMLSGLMSLENDVSSPKQKKYLDIILDPENHPLNEIIERERQEIKHA